MAGIFLSYSRADRPTAQTIAEALQAEGFTVWWDKVLRAGQTYDEVTENMLRESAVVVVLWSQTSVKSKWVRAEATLGERTAAVIPAMIEDAERPIMFELTQTADLIGWSGDTDEARWQGFVTDVRAVIEADEAEVEVAPTPTAAVVAGVDDATIETVFWTSIKDGSDPADFEAYLKRYPEGHYGDLARNRLAGMAPEEAPVAAEVEPVVAVAPVAVAAPIAPAPKGKLSKLIPVLIAGALLIGVVGWGASKMFSGGDDPGEGERVDVADVEPETPPTPVVVEQEEVEPEVGVEVEPEIALDETPAEIFAACGDCPEMIVIAAGVFTMGSPNDEPNRSGNEGPQREVTLGSFAISKTEITQKQWAACADAGGCGDKALSGDGLLPVVSVNWNEAVTYTTWLSTKTASTYRLPSEAQWEYAARGGTMTPYWWGADFAAGPDRDNGAIDVMDLSANPFSLLGMNGNVREWVEDCYASSYTDAPSDGIAVLSGDCSRRVVRGGSWKNGAAQHRAANRARISRSVQDRAVGFRVVEITD